MKIVRTDPSAERERVCQALGRHAPRECLDRILIVNRRQLEHVLRVYTAHYNRHRPHRSLSLRPPDGCTSAPAHAPERHIRRHELLGGLIHEHEAAA